MGFAETAILADNSSFRAVSGAAERSSIAMVHRSFGPTAIPIESNRSQRTAVIAYRSFWFEPLRRAVLALDRALRSALGIVKYSKCEDCILRIALRRAATNVCLPGRIDVMQADYIVELHFWNENLPALHYFGSPFGWAVRFRNQMRLSLRLLAAHAVTDPKIRSAKAFYARMVLPLDGRLRKCLAVAEEYGFSVTQDPCPAAHRIHDAFENLLVYALIFAFHPGKLTRRSAPLERLYWWISREDLLSRYRQPNNLDSESREIAYK
jgi:hypothetical protein